MARERHHVFAVLSFTVLPFAVLPFAVLPFAGADFTVGGTNLAVAFIRAITCSC